MNELIQAVTEVWMEIAFTLVIMGTLAVGCILTVDKPENDIEWKDIDGAK